MSLREAKGRNVELNLPALGRAAPVPGVLTKVLSLGGGGFLPVPLHMQEQRQWCWAACIQMVLRFLDSNDPVTQCQMANNAFEANGCCKTPSSSICDKPLPIYRVTPEWLRYNVQSSFTNHPVSFSSIRFEIDNNRPIETGMRIGNGGHAIIIIGYGVDGADEQVIVHDPWIGIKNMSYVELRSAYGETRGQWMCTWTGIRRA